MPANGEELGTLLVNVVPARHCSIQLCIPCTVMALGLVRKAVGCMEGSGLMR